MSGAEKMANKILTVSELADHLNVHRITIYRLLKDGSLPGFKIGRVWRFDLNEITNWMAAGKSGRQVMAADQALAHTDGHPGPHHTGGPQPRQPQNDGVAEHDGSRDGAAVPKPARQENSPQRVVRGSLGKESRAGKSSRS
jgi:excisionase family DNA binding protein